MSAVLESLFHADSVRILDALRQRVRYRYVQPVVLPADAGWRVVSPCCSRNVDRDGGVIDIAWLEPTTHGWRLHSRDHAAQRWALQAASGDMNELLDLLCLDPQRVFWP